MYYEQEVLGKHGLFFFKDCPALLLISIFKCEQNISPTYITKLIKMVNMTQSHAQKLIKKFEEFEFIEIEKKGKTSLITLTDKGRKFVKILIKIDNFYLTE